MYDYLKFFVMYGILIDVKARYCIDCIDTTNQILQTGHGGDFVVTKIMDNANVVTKILCQTFKTNMFRNILNRFESFQQKKLKRYELSNFVNITDNELYMLCSLTKKQYIKIYKFIINEVQKYLKKTKQNENDKIKMKLKNDDYIYVYLKEKFIHKSLIIYLCLLRHGIKYKWCAFLLDIKSYGTIKKYYFVGTILCRKFFTKIIASPSFLTKEKLMKNVPSDIVHLWGPKLLNKINVVCDGTDISISRAKEYDLSSWTFSGKSKKWSIRIMSFCSLNGLLLLSMPSETSFVSGRHNDASLFDFFICTNHNQINDILKPCMYIFLYMFLFIYTFQNVYL